MGGTFSKDLRTHWDVLRQGGCASCIPYQEQLFTARACASLSVLSQGNAEESVGEQSQGTLSLTEGLTKGYELRLGRNVLWEWIWLVPTNGYIWLHLLISTYCVYVFMCNTCMCRCVCVCRPGDSTSCYSSGAVLVLAVDRWIDHKTRSLTDLEFTQ